MRLRVVQTHRCGIPLSRRELSQAKGFVGQVLTETTTDERFNGAISVARLRDDTAGGTAANELIPCLYVPVLQILSVQGLLLFGHERLDERGRTRHFVQGWWARLP